MNTKLFGLFIALLVCLPSLAQQKPVEKVDSDGVYLMPDQMPEFPADAGDDEVFDYKYQVSCRSTEERRFWSCDRTVRHYGRRNIGSG